ncbi:hypothetical protein Mgra_00005907 [Meloidogyne graminicola]|uniref:BZIP domain-containing protein n=1 Tax=Meloidogyne graminicola TaxID=189291 RepID=A0A8S9ZNA4_9BILA|nr:hypothetical protein Mgra_00005907 [Meloidogyne graminicola]
MEIGQQQQQEKVKGNQLFVELTPPMDPSSSSFNDKNVEGQFCNKNLRHLNSICSSPAPPNSSQRLRPSTLPGLSAGLVAISANYGGGIFDQNNDQIQNSQIIENIQQQQNSYSVSSLSEQFTPLVAAAAYAFRHPQSNQFNSINPTLYSPYEGSQPSDPNTPTQQFAGNNNSTIMLSSLNQQLHNQNLINASSEVGTCNSALPIPPPAYAAVSSMAAAAAATTPFDASIFWNWPPLFSCSNGTELVNTFLLFQLLRLNTFLSNRSFIGYGTEHQNNLLFNPSSAASAAQHLLSPSVDFCTTQQHQQIDSGPSSILLDNNQQPHLWLAEHFAEATISSGTPSTCGINKLTTNSEKRQNTSTTVSSVFVPPLSIVGKSPTTAVSAMPRGQPRKGGRRPREQTGDCQLSGEDKDRLAKRRVRNKEAAARCRQRRQLLIQTLEERVTLLQTTNAEKDRKIKELQNEQNLLLNLSSMMTKGFQLSLQILWLYINKMAILQEEEGFFNFKRGGFGENILIGGGIGILIPQLENNKIRLQHQYASLPLCQHSSSSSSSVIADTTESTGISPTSPPSNMFYGQGRMDCDSRGCSVLVNGSDPVISESALIETPTSHCSPSFGHIKRSKFDPPPLLVKVEENVDDCSNNGKQLYQFETPNQTNFENNNSNIVRPDSLNFKKLRNVQEEDENLRVLRKAGYIVTTPSRGLIINGSYQNVSGSFLNTLAGNDCCADTPDVVSQLTESISQSYGVLGAQQLGITPCQNGPSVLIQTSSSADSVCEHPPSGGELSILLGKKLLFFMFLFLYIQNLHILRLFFIINKGIAFINYIFSTFIIISPIFYSLNLNLYRLKNIFLIFANPRLSYVAPNFSFNLLTLYQRQYVLEYAKVFSQLPCVTRDKQFKGAPLHWPNY